MNWTLECSPTGESVNCQYSTARLQHVTCCSSGPVVSHSVQVLASSLPKSMEKATQTPGNYECQQGSVSADNTVVVLRNCFL